MTVKCSLKLGLETLYSKVFNDVFLVLHMAGIISKPHQHIHFQQRIALKKCNLIPSPAVNGDYPLTD